MLAGLGSNLCVVTTVEFLYKVFINHRDRLLRGSACVLTAVIGPLAAVYFVAQGTAAFSAEILYPP